MNWGRKNTTPSGLSSISQVFPISWLSKFKQINSKSKSQPAKSKRKTKPNSSLRPTIPHSFRGTQIHYNGDVAGDDDDAYLQFSLRREDFEGKRSRGVAKSVWYDSDDELEFPITGHRSCRSSTQNFGDVVSSIRNIRDFGGEDREENVLGMPPKQHREGRKVTHRKSRKKDRILQEVSSDSGRESIKIGQTSSPTLEMNNLDLESKATTTEDEYSSFTDSSSRKSYYITFSNSKNIERNGTIGEVDQEFKALNLKKLDQNLEEEKEYRVDLNRKTVKEPKIKDSWSKREKRRKSIYLRGAKQSCKCSPRTALKIENCKIRALEDMKKAKTKKKERKVEEIPSLESFAVEKCSFNPQKDFRDSMVEMIMENGIRQSEELENLLACYLTLNSDEYHDLIVKVFREIWFDLNK